MGTSQKNAYVCWTVAISFKHAIAGKADPAQLTQTVPKLLTLLLDQKELGARNATLLMVYSAVHHMPQQVSGSIMKEQITPALYEVAAFKLERKIDLGPFSYKPIKLSLPCVHGNTPHPIWWLPRKILSNRWKKPSLRTMVALSNVECTMNSRKFAEFVDRISANSKFRSALEAIKEER